MSSSNGTNGTVVKPGADLDTVKVKAIVDGVKGWVQRELAKELAQHPGNQITNLGPTHRTEVVFPAKELAKILSEELSKSLASIKWPQASVEVHQGTVDVDNDAVAKALHEIGKMVSEVPIPVVEALDLSPIRDVIAKVAEGNQAVLAAVQAQTRAMELLVKTIITSQQNKPARIMIEHSDGTTSTVTKE
jgi:hypothetical protein